MSEAENLPDDWYTLGDTRRKQLLKVDGMSKGMRECVHDYGLPIVNVLSRNGVTDPKAIREIVHSCWLGSRAIGQDAGARGALDFILQRGPISSAQLQRFLADASLAIVGITPTKEMLAASMAEVAGHNVTCSKEEKHRRRLSAAIKVMIDPHKSK